MKNLFYTHAIFAVSEVDADSAGSNPTYVKAIVASLVHSSLAMSSPLASSLNGVASKTNGSFA